MATIVRMPEVLANTSEAILQSWLVTVGQVIAVGDPIADIETEKANVEYTAEVSGTLARLLVEPGSTITVGEPIAVVLAPGEEEGSDDNPIAPTTPTQRDEESGVLRATDEAVPAKGLRLFATPLVRKLASERGIDLGLVSGTGPGGRIVRRDLDRLAAAEPRDTSNQPVRPSAAPTSVTAAARETGGHTDVPLTGMRKAIARRLTESKTTVPHFYVTADCRVDTLIELRRAVNTDAARKISLNDFVLKAVAGALIEVPEANAIWNGDSIRRFDVADVAVAVAVEGGLLTPVLRGVDGLTLSAVSTSIAELAQRAHAGKLRQHELEGGSFSVSNLGMYGVAEFSAILNPPQSGILAVGAASTRPVVVDGELTVGTMMTVSLSVDHRVIDGIIAAQWMSAFVRRIENPMLILL